MCFAPSGLLEMVGRPLPGALPLAIWMAPPWGLMGAGCNRLFVRRRLPNAAFCGSAIPYLGLVTLLASTLLGCGRAAEEVSRSVEIPVGGDAVFRGTAYMPETRPAPGLLMLHGFGGDQAHWAGFAERSRREGYVVLTIDMPTLAASSPEEVVTQLGHCLDTLIEQGASADRIGVAGEGYGGSLAMLLAQAEPRIEAVALLSPQLRQRGVDLSDLIAHFAERPLLFLAGQRDTVGANAATSLKAQAPGYSEIRFYDTSAVGANLLAAHPNAMEQILEWLEPIIGPKRH